MGIIFLRASGHIRLPWRNGQGSSAEIVSRPGPDGPFDWRLSVATIDSNAEFSRFPGIERKLMALSQIGLELGLEGGQVALRQFDVHTFAGEDRVSAVDVTRPTLGLNLMTRRGRCSGSLAVERPSGDWSFVAGESDEAAVVLLDGRIHLGGVGLEQHDAVVIGPGSRLTLQGEGVLALARVQSRLNRPV